MSKEQFRAIRLVIGLSQAEFSELLGVSIGHVRRVEQWNSSGYGVSQNLAEKVETALESMGTSIPDMLEQAHRQGYLNGGKKR